jgi:hypothetical protein
VSPDAKESSVLTTIIGSIVAITVGVGAAIVVCVGASRVGSIVALGHGVAVGEPTDLLPQFARAQINNVILKIRIIAINENPIKILSKQC